MVESPAVAPRTRSAANSAALRLGLDLARSARAFRPAAAAFAAAAVVRLFSRCSMDTPGAMGAGDSKQHDMQNTALHVSDMVPECGGPASVAVLLYFAYDSWCGLIISQWRAR